MTNPGASDEWWKQYGSDGTPNDAPAEPTQYSSAPQFQAQPAPPPSVPVTPPPQPLPPQSPYGSTPQYPVQDMTPPPQPVAPAQPAYPQQAYPQPGYAYPNPAAYQPYGYAGQQPKTNGLAIAALILSLACCPPLGIILGLVALSQIKDRGDNGRGLALAAVWVGIAWSVVMVLWFGINILVISNDTSSNGY
ncbi:DUF4190 domain-containing protein [Nocardia stercoris]|uniref:DUF4190 domain-containing protein n=1 Tax=Nocardia stercoris TaxID=2483361 RepID=A0A3M2L9L8_9NOCA|nr:DUF4190 domain-containing protein [Nocardia stercoris]RMI34282.1 DUF4190 domain-containing protein [Nocardia stercoris]